MLGECLFLVSVNGWRIHSGVLRSTNPGGGIPSSSRSRFCPCACFSGLAVMLDLRLLGVTMRRTAVSEVMGQLLPWTGGRLVLMVISELCAVPLSLLRGADFLQRKLRKRPATVRAAQPGERERGVHEAQRDSGALPVSESLTSSGLLASVRRARRCRTSRGTTASHSQASGSARWLGATRLSPGTHRSRSRCRAVRIPW